MTMKYTITYGAKQRASGAWLPVYFVNGNAHYCNANIKKSERGAISQAKRFAEGLIEAKNANIQPHTWN
jgi:hypothetical protein